MWAPERTNSPFWSKDGFTKNKHVNNSTIARHQNVGNSTVNNNLSKLCPKMVCQSFVKKYPTPSVPQVKMTRDKQNPNHNSNAIYK